MARKRLVAFDHDARHVVAGDAMRGRLTDTNENRATADYIGMIATVMNSLALQILVVGFPEVLLLVIAANIYLGRWVGVRLFEYLRFRPVLLGGTR